MNKRIDQPETGGPAGRRVKGTMSFSGLLGRVVAALATATVLVVGFMFSVVVFAVALVVGAMVFGWLWWKTRRLLRQARQDPRFGTLGTGPDAQVPPRGGTVVEGEVVRAEWQDDQRPPGSR